MLARSGFTLKDVTLVNVNFSLSPALMAGQVEAVIGAYRNFELNQMDIAKRPGRAFYPEENGVPPYDELIYVAHRDASATSRCLGLPRRGRARRAVSRSTIPTRAGRCSSRAARRSSTTSSTGAPGATRCRASREPGRARHPALRALREVPARRQGHRQDAAGLVLRRRSRRADDGQRLAERSRPRYATAVARRHDASLRPRARRRHAAGRRSSGATWCRISRSSTRW